MNKSQADHLLFVAHKPDIVFSKGKGSYLWDTDGKQYLDFINGWAVNCYGHSPAFLADALKRQANRLINASPSFYNDIQIKYADLLCGVSSYDKAFFCPTGAEANECAIKLARKYGSIHKNGAHEIITLKKSFHGRTLSTMSASGKEKFKSLFEPKVPGFVHVDINDFDALENAVTANTCAVMMEPVQGEGGVYEIDRQYIEQVSALCKRNNILLIFDEIQTGLGRTGKLFCYEHFGVLPDIMTLGKGIGGGYPLAAMLCKKELDIFEAGDQGGTYSAVSLSMAAGHAVLTKILKDKLWENANEMGNAIMFRLHELAQQYGLSEIRGKGLIIAFDMERQDTAEFVTLCRGIGLLINSPQPGTIRIIPALNITKRHVDEFFQLLTRGFAMWKLQTKAEPVTERC